MALSAHDYPYIRNVGELVELASKGHWLTLAVDFARQLYGDDLTDDQLQSILAARLDTLAAPGTKLVPKAMPKRLPRHNP